MGEAGNTDHFRIRQGIEGDLDVVSCKHASSLVNLGEDVRVDV